MIDGVRPKIGRRLQKHVGNLEIETVRQPFEGSGTLVDILELSRRPEVRSTVKQADVDPLKAQHANQA